MLEPYRFIFDAVEAARHDGENGQRLARVTSEALEVLASTRATIFEAKQLIAAAKVLRDRPV